MRDQPLLPSSEIYVLNILEKNHFIYSKLYRITPEEPLIQEPFGVYANATFRKELFEFTSLERRRNLHGKKRFRSTALLRDPRSLETYQNYT